MTFLLDKMHNQNPWWMNERAIEEDRHIKELQKNKYIFLNENFLEHQFLDGVYIVTGPRQIGKTTHLKLLIKNKINKDNKENFIYFNCDLLDTKQDIVEVVGQYLKNFKRTGRKFVLLDEITSVRDSALAIKYLIDKGENELITYILTGSSTVNIKKTGEFLPGRRGKGKDFIFSPVSFSKLLNIRYPGINTTYASEEVLEKFYSQLNQQCPLSRELDGYLISGGIPRIINDYWDDQEIEQDNFELYKNWIVSEIAKCGKREIIAKIILQRIMYSIGSDVSYNSFASDTGISSHNTVYEYINFLEDAFIASQLYHYDYHQKTINIRKNKKIYLSDLFLFWLLDWWLNGNSEYYKRLAADTILKSRIVENAVFLHLKLLFGETFFYKAEQEIDFICKDAAWECKYQNKVASSDFKALLKFPGKKFVVTKADFGINPEYQMLPVELFLLLNKDYFSRQP